MAVNHGVSWGSHDFTIKGFSLAKGMGVGKYIGSHIFTASGYDWLIGFYPDGINSEDRSVYISVGLMLASEGSDVRALFEVKLLDQSGKGQHAVYGHFSKSLPRTIKSRGNMIGYERLFRRAFLETSDYLKDDCLSMHCTVGVVGSKHFTTCMTRNLNYLLETETGCDIVVRVGEQTFKAHKSILAARSPIFRAQFLINSMSDQVELNLKDIEPSIFKAMLLFIYSDTLPDSMSTDIIQHLLIAADRFGVDRLKQLCEVKLCEQVNADTVETTLSFADEHRCLLLKCACLKFASELSGGLIKKKGHNYLLEECKVLLSQLEETKDQVKHH